MKSFTKKTKSICIILALLTVAVIGGTIAYYMNQKDFENEFHVPKPGVAIREKFNPADYWVPGEEKSKEVWFTNTEELDMLLRFSVEAEWEGNGPQKDIEAKDIITLYWNGGTDQEGNDIRSEENERLIDFIPIEQDGTTYYYYTKVLKAGESTQKVLESVKFSDKLSNDGHLNSDYSGVQVNLTIKGETVLVDQDAVKEQWPGVTVNNWGNDKEKPQDENDLKWVKSE